MTATHELEINARTERSERLHYRYHNADHLRMEYMDANLRSNSHEDVSSIIICSDKLQICVRDFFLWTCRMHPTSNLSVGTPYGAWYCLTYTFQLKLAVFPGRLSTSIHTPLYD